MFCISNISQFLKHGLTNVSPCNLRAKIDLISLFWDNWSPGTMRFDRKHGADRRIADLCRHPVVNVGTVFDGVYDSNFIVNNQ